MLTQSDRETKEGPYKQLPCRVGKPSAHVDKQRQTGEPIFCQMLSWRKRVHVTRTTISPPSCDDAATFEDKLQKKNEGKAYPQV